MEDIVDEYMEEMSVRLSQVVEESPDIKFRQIRVSDPQHKESPSLKITGTANFSYDVDCSVSETCSYAVRRL